MKIKFENKSQARSYLLKMIRLMKANEVKHKKMIDEYEIKFATAKNARQLEGLHKMFDKKDMYFNHMDNLMYFNYHNVMHKLFGEISSEEFLKFEDKFIDKDFVTYMFKTYTPYLDKSISVYEV